MDILKAKINANKNCKWCFGKGVVSVSPIGAKDMNGKQIVAQDYCRCAKNGMSRSK